MITIRQLRLSETAVESCIPCADLGFQASVFVFIFVSGTIKQYLEAPDLRLYYYFLATLGGGLEKSFAFLAGITHLKNKYQENQLQLQLCIAYKPNLCSVLFKAAYGLLF